MSSAATPPPLRILGAGLSGLAAAITLARAGRSVEVFEKRSDCGMRFGGDLQGLENWSSDQDVVDELHALGLDTDFHCAPFWSGVQTNGRRTEHLKFPRPAFYLVKRGRAHDTVDQSFKRQALAAGVTLHFGKTASPHSVDIDASGPVGRAPFAVDTGIVFETDAPDQAVALLNDRAGYKGYSYLLITQGYGCCCAMTYERFGDVHANFAEARRVLLDNAGITVRNPRTVGGLGHFTLDARWMSGDTRRVGEAAGLQDYLWGFGMRLAVRSGVLAAQSVLQDFSYREQAEAAFAPVRRAGVVNRFLWELGRVANYQPIMSLLKVRGPYPVLRWGHRDSLVQRALWPVAKWWVGRQLQRPSVRAGSTRRVAVDPPESAGRQTDPLTHRLG